MELRDQTELQNYENFLIKKRGWVSKWPESAVFIYSGGMDSTITIASMLEEYDIKIYPLFINRGQSNIEYERKSALFFDSFFKEKYPTKYNNLVEIGVNIPPVEIKEDLKSYTQTFGHPLRNTLLQMIGVQYGISLLNKGFKIKTVFCAQVPDDPFPHSTLSSARCNTINVCESLNEWDWQITSPNIDTLLVQNPRGKIDMVKWASERGIPLEKTRSCYAPSENPCGVCLTCKRRKEAFKLAGVTDKDIYLN